MPDAKSSLGVQENTIGARVRGGSQTKTNRGKGYYWGDSSQGGAREVINVCTRHFAGGGEKLSNEGRGFGWFGRNEARTGKVQSRAEKEDSLSGAWGGKRPPVRKKLSGTKRREASGEKIQAVSAWLAESRFYQQTELYFGQRKALRKTKKEGGLPGRTKMTSRSGRAGAWSKGGKGQVEGYTRKERFS